jgi:hypothetical protein
MMTNTLITRNNFKRILIVMSAVIALGVSQGAAQEPVIKQGVCPTGYYAAGSYCMPGQNARPAIPKSGICPAGYTTAGAYCLGGGRAPQAIPRRGICPPGYVGSGEYCTKPRR